MVHTTFNRIITVGNRGAEGAAAPPGPRKNGGWAGLDAYLFPKEHMCSQVEKFRSALIKFRGEMQIFQISCFSLIRGYKETYKHNYLIYQNTESTQGF